MYIVLQGNFPIDLGNPANVSTFQHHYLLVDTTSRRGTTSNKRWNNVLHFNVGIYNVRQRRINVEYFNVDMNNVRKHRNNFVIFQFEFHNVSKCRNNVEKVTISKKNKQKNVSNRIYGIQSFNYYFLIFFTLLLMLRGICRRVFTKPRKLLQDLEKYCISRT